MNNIENVIKTQLEIEEKFEDYVRRSMETRKGIRDTMIKFLELKKDMIERGSTNKEVLKLEEKIDEKVKFLLQEQKKYDSKILDISRRQFQMSDTFYELLQEIIDIVKKENEYERA